MASHHSYSREEDEDDESDEEGEEGKGLLQREGGWVGLVEWGAVVRRVVRGWVMAVFEEDGGGEEEGERQGLLGGRKGEEEGEGRRGSLNKAFVVFRSYAAATLAQQVGTDMTLIG